MARDPGTLVRGSVEVSSLPAIYTRLNEALNNPRASASQIADVIAEDTGLTARLLRLANSPFYGFPSRIETVSRAVLIIGTQQIRDLALATSVMSAFRGVPGDLVDMESFWLHSMATGVAARVLASQRREANVERFFVAGVLHDIGRLLLYKRLPAEARVALDRARDGDELLFESERAVMGCDHGGVGGALLEAWGIPASLQEVAACHHDPGRAERYPLEAAVVHVADILAHAMEMGTSGERAVPPLDPPAWERIGLPATVLAAVLDQADRQVAAAALLIQPVSRAA